MEDCVFCKVISGELKTKVIYRDDEMIAINDINPQAPVHLLLMPLKHIPTINDLTPEDVSLMGRLIIKGKELALQNPNLEKGYRLVLNCNTFGGQAVYHIHLHIMGGRRMTWPPG
ncbi:MAG: histidine triad nucleotide-binding protein [Patescibacteria group bacterium]|nr:histidine triad nucleotide-binding protein [Patescibacteria group bacterium]